MSAVCVLNLGRAARHAGDAERALALNGEALRAFVRLDNAWGVAVCLDGIACLAADRGDFLGAARLYGASGAPASLEAWQALLVHTAPSLEPSPVIAEFLAIMRSAPILPFAMRPLQRLLVAAAILLGRL